MAHLPMGEVVRSSEYGVPRIYCDVGSMSNATTHLSAQMFTDAVFNADIRVIQTIINRVDGGLPKDTELENYQTLFGDCMNEVLAMEDAMQLKVVPDDSVMMAMCKSLYSIASKDIYNEVRSDKNGNKWSRKVNPTTEAKQSRDSALRLILERAGGRKTVTPANTKEAAKVIVADWIVQALPQTGEEDGPGAETD